MDRLTEEQSNSLLLKPWLVKNDGPRSVYLMKFTLHSQNSAILLATDTKKSWYEVLSFNSIKNRWIRLNPSQTTIDVPSILDKLVNAHTVSGFTNADFTLEETEDYDLSFGFNFDLEWFWHWNLVLLGPHRSSELLSTHLIFPLLLSNHLALQSLSSQTSFTLPSWEKSLDTVASHAKKALIHQVKGAASKPLVSQTLQRLTSSMNGEKPLCSIREPLTRPEPPTELVSSNASAASTNRNYGVPCGTDESFIRNKVEPLKDDITTPPNLNIAAQISHPDHGVRSSPLPLTSQIKNSTANDGDESVTEPDDDVAPLVRSSRVKEERDKKENKSSGSELEPPTKKVKVAPKSHPVSSTDNSDDESDQPITVPATKKRVPVRQPVRRGGKKW